tara:strand:- start:9098 stop:11065 length:1968 start_codon:yes stop_codon:yes gene_type:complete
MKTKTLTDKKSVYLFELSDVMADQVYLPYSSGVVWSYLQKDENLRSNYELADYFYHNDDLGIILSKIKDPDVLAFSSFLWNWNVNNEIAKDIKERYPNCLIIFGGQHQPLPDRQQNFFREYPWCDIMVHGEGEITFAEILTEHLNEKPNYAGIAGTSVQCKKTKDRIKSPARPRIQELYDMPSPYLDGLFDWLVEKNRKDNTGLTFHATIEGTRGCPYFCTFCEMSGKYYQKLKSNYGPKFFAEIDWLAENQIEYVTDANSNFGIYYDEDTKIANYVLDKKTETGYPHAYRVTWAKGKAEKLLELAKILQDGDLQKGMTVALQSFSKKALKAIKRRNIVEDKLEETIQLYESKGISSYIELIWGLPGETLESFIDGMATVPELGYHNYLDCHLLSALPNTPFGEPSYIEEHGIEWVETQPRFAHVDISMRSEKTATMSEKFVITTNDMSAEDYIDGHQFRWLLIFGHYLGCTQFLARFITKHYNMSYKEFYTKLMSYCIHNPDSFIGKEYLMVKNDLHETLYNNRYWGTVVDEISPINWLPDEGTAIKVAMDHKGFLADMECFILTLNLDIEDDLLTDILKYQDNRLTTYKKTYPLSESFKYNIHDVIESDQPLGDTDHVLEFNAPTYDGPFNFAQQVIWYGRRVARYKSEVKKL